MSDESTSFTIDLPVTGTEKIDAASASVDFLAARLDSATKAVQAQETAYRTAEQTADRAAKALERIGVAAEAQRDKMRAAMELGNEKAFWHAAGALTNLQKSQEIATEKAKKAKSALDVEAASLDKLKGQADKLDKALKAKKGDDSGPINFEGLRRGLSKFGGPLASVGEKVADVGSGFSKLTKVLGEGGGYVAAAAGFAAIAAAIVAIGAAAAAAIVAVAAFAVKLADTARTNELLAQGMLRFSKTGGAELNDKINFLTRRLPLTREEIASTAAELANAGLRGKALSDNLQRLTIRAAQLKFGPQWEKQMLSLDEQSKVFSANIARLFGGLKIEGLLKGLQTLGALFDIDTESGKAIKVVFESLFQPLVDGATGAVPMIERFFLKTEILVLKTLILLKEFVGYVSHMWDAITTGAAIFYDIGRQMLEGIIHGITDGGPKLLAALKDAVMSSVDSLKADLGIQSPSKVLDKEVGDPMGAGVERGLMRRKGGVQDALEAMTSPSAAKSAAATSDASAGGTSAKASVNFAGAKFIFNGVKDAEDAEGKFGDVMTRIFEGDAAQLGALSPAAG